MLESIQVWLGVEAQSYNPTYLESRDRRITIRGHLRQNVSETLSQNQTEFGGTCL
jgi:hypothetical protein